MPADFFRTTRALSADSSIKPLLVLLVAATLGAAWAAWFVGARVGVRATSVSARAQGTRAVATFPRAYAATHVREGQPGWFRADPRRWPAHGTLVGRVTRVDLEAQPDLAEVELTLSEALSGRMPQTVEVTGEVDVEVERVSPLELVLSAAGGHPAPSGQVDTGPGT